MNGLWFFVFMSSLIVGLGNPGVKHERTRHNLGYRVVDELAARNDQSFKLGKGEYLFCEFEKEKQGIVCLIKPLTYMNDSGLAVVEVLDHFEKEIEDLLVLCDDVNLPLGVLRIREKGTDGGHKGLKSIIYHLGSIMFPRLRMGIGDVSEGNRLEDFVLTEFIQEEREEVERMIQTACKAVEIVWTFGIQDSMNRLNVQ